MHNSRGAAPHTGPLSIKLHSHMVRMELGFFTDAPSEIAVQGPGMAIKRRNPEAGFCDANAMQSSEAKY